MVSESVGINTCKENRLTVSLREETPLGWRSRSGGLYGSVGDACLGRWGYAEASLWRDGGASQRLDLREERDEGLFRDACYPRSEGENWERSVSRRSVELAVLEAVRGMREAHCVRCGCKTLLRSRQKPFRWQAWGRGCVGGGVAWSWREGKPQAVTANSIFSELTGETGQQR